jgi:hypothetical protein
MKTFKMICLVAVLILSLAGNSWAAGSCVVSGWETVKIDGKAQRTYVTLTCTGDGSITAYSLNPNTYGIRGWYLYNVTTNPGTAPTAAYDITLVVDGEDVAGGKLADRSATATETVVIASSTIGYFMMDGAMSITFAGNTANPSVIVMTLRFTSN